MDITIEVMLPARGAGDFSSPANPKYGVLSPVAVYELKSAPVVGMPMTGYLHVTNIPTPPGWDVISEEEMRRRLNAVLCESEWEMLPEGPRVKARRVWDADVSQLPPPVRNALLNDRQATISWGQCKALFKHRLSTQNLKDADFG